MNTKEEQKFLKEHRFLQKRTPEGADDWVDFMGSNRIYLHTDQGILRLTTREIFALAATALENEEHTIQLTIQVSVTNMDRTQFDKDLEYRLEKFLNEAGHTIWNFEYEDLGPTVAPPEEND